MFHNPFNSKIVSDITNFLNEHRNDVNLTPCLAEKAEAAAEVIAESVVLEDRRNTLVRLFNEAVTECGCRGTTKEANDFAKAVEMKLESKKIVVPGKTVTNPNGKDSELAKMGKKAVVPGKKGSPAAEANDLSKMGKTAVVPAKKTSEPSHKDSDIAKMGKKIVVPGK